MMATDDRRVGVLRAAVWWALSGLVALGACSGGGGAVPDTKASLDVSVVGSVSVTSNPTGIGCKAGCSAPFALGTVVTPAPLADAGSVFAGWRGDADCSDGSVTMSAARHCTATFAVSIAGSRSRIMGGHDFSLARSRSGGVFFLGLGCCQGSGQRRRGTAPERARSDHAGSPTQVPGLALD